MSDGEPPTAGAWGRGGVGHSLLSAPTIPVRELARVLVPDEPGVYLWRHDGQTVYVGMARGLRSREVENQNYPPNLQ